MNSKPIKRGKPTPHWAGLPAHPESVQPKFPKPSAILTGKRPEIVIALERFKSEVVWATKPHGRAIVKVLEHAARKAINRAAARQKKVARKEAMQKHPKKVAEQELRAELREKLNALSHKVAFALTPGYDPETREGLCFTCGKPAVLQWGHFIRQSDCPWLVYHQHGTRGQCAGCNGPGLGKHTEFHAALEKEKPGRAQMLIAIWKEKGKKHPKSYEYAEMLKRLTAFAESIGIEVGA